MVLKQDPRSTPVTAGGTAFAPESREMVKPVVLPVPEHRHRADPDSPQTAAPVDRSGKSSYSLQNACLCAAI